MIDLAVLTGYAARMSAEQGRSVSEAEAEAEILRIIGVVSAKFGGYAFGCHEAADIVQEAWMYGWEALSRYDPTRPLANFMAGHIRRKLANKYRKECYRTERPCRCCNPADPPESPCKSYQIWDRGNAAKQRLCRPNSLVLDRDGTTYDAPALYEDPSDPAMASELYAYILERLPAGLVDDFRLLVIDSQQLGPERRQRVRGACREIVRLSPHCPTDELAPPTSTPPPPPPAVRQIEYEGRSHDLSEWSRITGVRRTTISNRIDSGWSTGQVLGFEPPPARPSPMPPNVRQIEYEGRSHNLSQWSRITGVHSATISSRLKSGWSTGQALGLEPPPVKTPRPRKSKPKPAKERKPKPRVSTPKKPRGSLGKQITYQGATHSIRGWERILGLVHGRIARRLRSGMSVEDAFSLNKPITSNRDARRIAYDGRSLTLHDWAKITGIAPRTLRYRINHGWPIADTLFWPAGSPRPTR